MAIIHIHRKQVGLSQLKILIHLYMFIFENLCLNLWNWDQGATAHDLYEIRLLTKRGLHDLPALNN